MNLRTLFFSIFTLTFLSVSAQESRKTVILYNVVPLSVELLQDGTIKTIYGKADHFFKGYQLIQREEYVNGNNGEQEYGTMSEDIAISTEVYRMEFDDQVALLNQKTINALDEVKNLLFLNPDKKILISPYAIDESNKREVILVKNRLASCLSYLEIMGVNKDQIVLDSAPQINFKDEIIATAIAKSELMSDNSN